MLPIENVLLQEPAENYRCAVCYSNPMLDATSFSCGHSVCGECSPKLKKCPLCRVDITARFPNWALRSLVGDMKCRCDFHFDESRTYKEVKRTKQQRCPAIFTLDNRKSHIESCDHAFDFCNRCSNFFLRKEFDEHRSRCGHHATRNKIARSAIERQLHLNIYTKSTSNKVLVHRFQCPESAQFQRVVGILMQMNKRFESAKFVYKNMLISDTTKPLTDLGMSTDMEVSVLALLRGD